MQQRITSKHFTELKAYKRRNTLSPDVWFSMARLASLLFGAQTGEFLEPRQIVPVVGYDAEKAAKEVMDAAERAMDKRSQ